MLHPPTVKLTATITSVLLSTILLLTGCVCNFGPREQTRKPSLDRDQERLIALEIVDFYVLTQGFLEDHFLSDERIMSRALSTVAHARDISREEVSSRIQSFVVSTKNEPIARQMDKALALFVEGKFADSANLLTKASKMSQEEVFGGATEKSIVFSKLLEGRAYLAAKNYAQAHRVFLGLKKRAGQEEKYMIHLLDGFALSGIAHMSVGKKLIIFRNLTAAAFRNALTQVTFESQPKEWANAQTMLGLAQQFQAGGTLGEERIKFLSSARSAFLAASTVFTRDTNPLSWSRIQVRHGRVLEEQAASKTAESRDLLTDQAETLIRESITIFKDKNAAVELAWSQYNLANVLYCRCLGIG